MPSSTLAQPIQSDSKRTAWIRHLESAGKHSARVLLCLLFAWSSSLRPWSISRNKCTKSGKAYAGARVVIICIVSTESLRTLNQENAHEWLSAGLANDVFGGLVALQLTLSALLPVLSTVALSLLLRFSSLARGYKRTIWSIIGRTFPIYRFVALSRGV